MGDLFGHAQIIRHEPDGRVRVETRPFVVMNAGGRADLGQVRW
jgi:hypothetical protein